MSEVKATKAAVFAAADAIKANGDTPTVRRIWERLGGGSHTTINSELKAWLKMEEEDREVAGTISDSVMEKAAEFGRKLWHEAHKHANAAIQEAEARWTSDTKRLSNDLEFAQIEIARLEASEATQAEKLDEANAVILRMQRELGEAKAYEAKSFDLQERISASTEEIRLLRQSDTESARVIGRLEGEAAALRLQVREMAEAMAKGRSAST